MAPAGVHVRAVAGLMVLALSSWLTRRAHASGVLVSLVAGGSNLTQWNGTTWSTLGGGPGITNVQAMIYYDDVLIAAGRSGSGHGSSYEAVQWDGTAWSTRGGQMNGPIYVLADYLYANNALIVGGNFSTAGGVHVNGIAQWSGAGWSAMAGGLGTVYAVTFYGLALIAGGSFTAQTGNGAVNNLAQWYGAIGVLEWSALGGLGSAVSYPVYALTVYDSVLIVAGGFSTNIARWNGQQWSMLDSGLNGPVYALAVFNGTLIVGGAFATAGNLSTQCLAQWDGVEWLPLESGLVDGDQVTSFTLFNDSLIAGGSGTFSSGGPGLPAVNIAQWQGAFAWSAIGTGGPQAGFTVSALAVYNFCPFGFYGASCTEQCPPCVFGSCVAGLGGNGSCACEGGWSGPLCQTCPSGYYGNLTSCIECPATYFCPFGASSPLIEDPVALPPTVVAVATSQAAALPLSIGLLFLVGYGASGLLWTLVVVLFRRPLRSFVVKFSMILNTPEWLLLVKNDRVVVPTSFFRGIIGFWVVWGVMTITAYQAYNFALNRYSTASSLQSGLAFSNGQSIFSPPTQITCEVTLVSSSVACSSLFSATAYIGSLALPTPTCTASGNLTSFSFGTTNSKLAVSVASPLLNLVFAVTGKNGSLAYSPALSYSYSALAYDGTTFTLTETVVGNDTELITGATNVGLSLVPTEVQDANQDVVNIGFTFAHTSTSPGLDSGGTPSLSVVFGMSVPAYYQLIEQVEVISILVFVSGIFALGGGVVAGGTLLAFTYSFIVFHAWSPTDDAKQRDMAPSPSTQTINLGTSTIVIPASPTTQTTPRAGRTASSGPDKSAGLNYEMRPTGLYNYYS